VKKVEYPAFQIRHVDVMGSGRFSYCSPPEKKTVDLEKR
jgi:hypothetical protein